MSTKGGESTNRCLGAYKNSQNVRVTEIHFVQSEQCTSPCRLIPITFPAGWLVVGLRFVMDVSSSMARFNGSDRRLDRMCASTVMIMEAFQGLEHKYHYEIVGHSGESHRIPFVQSSDELDGMPRSRKERLAIIQEMYSRA
jgi:hypothetical protein